MADIEKKVELECVRVLPRVDILESEEAYLILADMPGVEPGDVSINLDHGDLMVEGRQVFADDVCVAPLLFARSFRVPGNVTGESIDARIVDGVLTITLRKAEEDRPRKIEVKAD
jgi:HSP20 family protein